MEKLKKLLESLFNSNTGYFIKEHLYCWEGELKIAFVLCRGYAILGIPGWDRVGVFLTKEEALESKKLLES